MILGAEGLDFDRPHQGGNLARGPPVEAMQQAVSDVLDHLGEYQEELATLMVDEFHVIQKDEIPVQYLGA